MKRIAEFWDDAIVPSLVEYIRIPAKSPHFDKAWEKNGHIEAAVKLAEGWCRKHAVPGMTIELARLPGRTPVLLLEVPASNGKEKSGTVLMYGHLDKQPEMTGWTEGLGPWVPQIKDGKLYGRGGAGDGCAAFAALSAVRDLKEEKKSPPRSVLPIERCDETGRP